MNKKNFITVALIIVLGFAAYGNSLNGEFIWDDDYFIKNNVYIKNWSNTPKIFSESIGSGAGVPRIYSFYRPFQLFTYVVEHSLWKLDIRGYHVTNISLHILVALTVFWLVSLLFHHWPLSLLTSLFFIVHPIHTEAVAYISGRADSLATLFILLAFIFYIKDLHAHNRVLSFLMSLCYALALLSKEISLILPVLLLLYHYSFRKRLRVKQLIPILSLGFLYICLRLTFLKFLLSYKSSSTIFLQRLPGFFVALSNYAKLMLLPFNLHMEYGKQLFHIGHPQALLGLLIFFFALLYLVRTRKTRGLVFFSLSWFFIAILPVSNLYPLNAYMAEHWLYLPSIGLFLIIAQGVSYLYKTKHRKTFVVSLTSALLAFYTVLTIRQNNYWKEPIVFYERNLHYTKDSPRMYNNLGNLYYRSGEKEKAVALYKKAIELNPDFVYAYSNIAVAYSESGKKEEAIAFYRKAIAVNPYLADAYYNLGNVYKEIGKNEQAMPSYKKAIELNPNFVKAYNNLGLVYGRLNRQEEAVASYKKAIAINPDYAQAYHNLSVSYFRQEQYKLAIEYCDKAKALGFSNPAYLEALRPYRE